MTRSLPPRPNLEHLRRQAKQLLSDQQRRDSTVCATLRKLRRFADASDTDILEGTVALGEVQLALALDYGFPTWEALKAHVARCEQAPVPPSPATPITVRPIARDELQRVVLRCWPPQQDILERLFEQQGTIGFAAWEDGRCVAEHHGYRMDSPGKPNALWPSWNNWWRPDHWKESTRRAVMDLPGPVWCHACFHVGRTLRSARQEMLGLHRRMALKHGWDARRVCEALNALCGVRVTGEDVAAMLAELQQTGQREFQTVEGGYHGRGIGTALTAATVAWARDQGYRTVIASALPADLGPMLHLSGGLPWTTFAKLGYRDLGYTADESALPSWAAGGMPPDVLDAVRCGVAAGRKPETFHIRLMALVL